MKTQYCYSYVSNPYDYDEMDVHEIGLFDYENETNEPYTNYDVEIDDLIGPYL